MNFKVLKRPGWDEYFINLAEVVRTRSNCIRLQVGAVIVQGRHIIATGYNGTPFGIKNCCDGGCQRCLDRENQRLRVNERKDLCICLHAEENAIIQSAYHGVSTHGAVMYVTMAPCLQCAKKIINAGIVKVIYRLSHQDDLGIRLLRQAAVAVTCYSSPR
ncbi:cytidine/deoxycytidylate deaminase family protein [Patescibacteria group bacterium]|nr:cytidine/deoxycytidylate deaminase family protein [Patescibacteria group bacterium]MCL5091270.1 cytidine/deoxycytidylate deaminase family protein [Patescibacteria group bacterium]